MECLEASMTFNNVTSFHRTLREICSPCGEIQLQSGFLAALQLVCIYIVFVIFFILIEFSRVKMTTTLCTGPIDL